MAEASHICWHLSNLSLPLAITGTLLLPVSNACRCCLLMLAAADADAVCCSYLCMLLDHSDITVTSQQFAPAAMTCAGAAGCLQSSDTYGHHNFALAAPQHHC